MQDEQPDSFSAQLHAEAQDIWNAIFAHPFLRELQAGVLPVAKFAYFITQDYHYIGTFGRAVGLAIAKAAHSATAELLYKRLLAPTERPLHVKMFGLLGLDEEEVEQVRPAPTNLAYMNHILNVAWQGGLGETAAALLPCAWTYHENGKRLAAGPALDHPVYREWASFYMAGWLAESVAAWRSFLDASAAVSGPRGRAAMRDAFLTSSRYEYMFWDMAYREERWPV